MKLHTLFIYSLILALGSTALIARPIKVKIVYSSQLSAPSGETFTIDVPDEVLRNPFTRASFVKRKLTELPELLEKTFIDNALTDYQEANGEIIFYNSVSINNLISDPHSESESSQQTRLLIDLKEQELTHRRPSHGGWVDPESPLTPERMQLSAICGASTKWLKDRSQCCRIRECTSKKVCACATLLTIIGVVITLAIRKKMSQ